MRKDRRWPLVVIAILLGAALLAPAGAGAQSGGFQEPFSDPELPGWEHPPEAEVVEGVLEVRPGGYALHFGDWGDITLTVKLRFAGEGQAMIRYYFRDEGSYALVISSGALSVDRIEAHSLVSLGRAEVTALQPDTWVSVKIAVSGGEQQVYVDDELVLETTDPAPLETGAILLTTQGGLTAEFDDLEVRGTHTAGPIGAEAAGPQDAGTAAQAAQPPATESAAPAVPSSSSRGGLEGLAAEFFASQASRPDLVTFLINLILSAACSAILGLVYVHWGASLSNRRKFAANLILMAMTTTFIILVVRSSVALSLGLVGALSIVRFRTAVKEPEELAYLFVAIGIGIGLGDNQRLITLLALAGVTIIILLQRLLRRPEADMNLHLAVASHGPDRPGMEQMMAALRPHVAKLRLLRFDETAGGLEAAFLVEFGRMERLSEARAALRALSESIEISFTDDKGLW